MNPDPDSTRKTPDGARTPLVALDAIVSAPDWDSALSDPEAFAQETALACLAADAAMSAASLSILFTDDAELRALNNQFRGQDKPTNVLSFPSLSPDDGLGDVAIAFETTAREAAAQNKRFEDHARHLIAHGVLHLLGYDHEDDSEAETMEALERTVLARFGISDPYAAGPMQIEDWQTDNGQTDDDGGTER